MSIAPVTQTFEPLLTAEEYAALPDDRRTELVKGRIVEMQPTGFRHGKVQAGIARLLANFVEARHLGHVLTESGVITGRNPDTVRGPDISFYSYERIPKGTVPEVYATVAPEVVFEVRSPDDRVGEVLKKVGEYLSAGVLRVYVVDPQRRNVVMYGEDDFVTILSENDILRFPSPLESWMPRVADFLPGMIAVMQHRFQTYLQQQLDGIRSAGLYKSERVIATPQDAHIRTTAGREVLNLCANNYLGLADHPEVVAAAKRSLDEWGFGMASVRFICGTQSVHKSLESKVSAFLGTDDTILYSSCFDANGGLFETLLGPEDAIISDELNHASIIDGIRLCKAKRFRYRNSDMADLESKLQEAANARFRMIATDGVFSMDGFVANLPAICELADRYDALVMVDDSHSVGFMGSRGRGTHEYYGVVDRIDILTGTLGKALGGASGGYTSGRKEIVELLRRRSRPYLFSNSLAPPIVAASLTALDLLSESTELQDRLKANTAFWRSRIAQVGFEVLPGDHPITPVIIGDAALAGRLADVLLERGVYVIGFSYPVVPQGKARIRTQVSAAHTQEDLAFAAEQFAAAKQDLRI